MEVIGDQAFWLGLLSLLPLLVYIILIFRDADPIPVTLICVILGAVVTGTGLMGLGKALTKAMGSFLAVIGLIMMLGRGLGEVMTATKVSHTLVYKIVYGIGIKTKKQAMIGISIASFVLIALLGTMAGGEAIMAPIVIPIAASVGLSKSTIATIFDTMGEEGLIIGPFTPAVLTLMSITHIAYPQYIFFVAVPFVLTTIVITWFNLQKIQKKTENDNQYECEADTSSFVPTKESKRATMSFAIVFALALVYGFKVNAGMPFIVMLMLTLTLVTGLTGGLTLKKTCALLVKGMQGNLGLFFLFLLLDPFLGFVEAGGGFKAIALLMQPIVALSGKAGLVLTGGLIGAFGISGAAVAQLKVMDSMFGPLIQQAGASMFAWAAALIVGSRVTSLIYPGLNMFGACGFAQTDDIKSVLRNGWMISAAHCSLLIVYAILIA